VAGSLADDEPAGSGTLSAGAGLEGGSVALLVGGASANISIAFESLSLAVMGKDPQHGASAGVDQM
jgi:hypothetical protein